MFAANTPMRRLLRGAGCEIVLDQSDAGTEEIALAICSLDGDQPSAASATKSIAEMTPMGLRRPP